MGFLHRLRVAVWGVPPHTAAERRLLVKVDFFVLTYVCLMYWVSSQEIRALPLHCRRLIHPTGKLPGPRQPQQRLRLRRPRRPQLQRHPAQPDQHHLLRRLPLRSDPKQLDHAESPPRPLAADHLHGMGPPHTRHGIRAPPLANHGHPLLSRNLRSQLLCRRAVDSGLVVQARGDWEAYRHLHQLWIDWDSV